MTNILEKLKEFHTAFKVPKINQTDKTLACEDLELRLNLIREEISETIDAVRDLEEAISLREFDNLHVMEKEVLDGIVDSVYVLVAAAECLGYDFDGAFDNVHASNMSKLGDDGEPILREDGKVLKGPNYFKPELGSFLKDGKQHTVIEKLAMNITDSD